LRPLSQARHVEAPASRKLSRAQRALDSWTPGCLTPQETMILKVENEQKELVGWEDISWIFHDIS